MKVLTSTFLLVLLLAAGFLFGSLLDLSSRQQLFPAACALGVWGLLLINRREAVDNDLALHDTMQNDVVVDPVTALLRRDDTLSDEEAREWLDTLLQEQQK